jgi:serine/threonine protein kinase
MLHVPPNDESLSTLEGATIPSDMQPGVSYKIDRTLGDGGMSIAFSAVRRAPDGQTQVVLKILRPAMARDPAGTGALVVRKEAVALGRLNERVPATPFVVRLVDTGVVEVSDGGRPLPLPWLAIEHVHGGALGTTLEERVQWSLRHTGYGFDPERAANAVVCLAGGISAIHEATVLHRDIKPSNVLCCGFGAEEIFKIADFGIARPAGMAGTFGGAGFATPGYAAPEQIMNDHPRLGPWSDVFSLAAVIYNLITGEEYFPADTPSAAVILIHRPERRRLADARTLCPELRARPNVCATIDGALARATAENPDHRPQSAEVLAAMVLPALRAEASRGRFSERRAKSLIGISKTGSGGVSWVVHHRPGGDEVVRCVAWESDGRCLAATTRGLAFWSGTSWQRPDAPGLPDPSRIHFVRRVDAGVYLLGGDGATILRYAGREVTEALAGRDPEVRFVLASGDIADLAVFVGLSPGEAPMLHGVAARHWIKPAALTRAAAITSASQLDGERWLVTGRASAGEGFVVMYEPLMWEVKRVRTPAARAYLASATRPDLGLGLVAGTGGQTVRFDGDKTAARVVDDEPDIAAVALDAEGRAWAASVGRIWTMDPESAPAWRPAWRDPTWAVPFVSLFADVGRVIAMTADGGILEGRL